MNWIPTPPPLLQSLNPVTIEKDLFPPGMEKFIEEDIEFYASNFVSVATTLIQKIGRDNIQLSPIELRATFTKKDGKEVNERVFSSFASSETMEDLCAKQSMFFFSPFTQFFSPS